MAWEQNTTSQSIDILLNNTTFHYELGQRFAMKGMLPQFVCFTSSNGRLQMMQDYLHRSRDPGHAHDIQESLQILKAVL
jgi:hypothetical protein